MTLGFLFRLFDADRDQGRDDLELGALGFIPEVVSSDFDLYDRRGHTRWRQSRSTASVESSVAGYPPDRRLCATTFVHVALRGRHGTAQRPKAANVGAGARPRAAGSLWRGSARRRR